MTTSATAGTTGAIRMMPMTTGFGEMIMTTGVGGMTPATAMSEMTEEKTGETLTNFDFALSHNIHSNP